ncbi:hypothetical protein [Peribacillus loiseleuriae]|uniref:hypothetical protein n=1 Tax=Peribacillus loiseleuriae TaxID=1679170 RepID=UPI003D00D680
MKKTKNGCCFKGCNITSSKLLVYIDDGTNVYALCPLHLPFYLEKDEQYRDFLCPLNSTRVPIPCILSKEKHYTKYYTTYENGKKIDVSLCSHHLQNLLTHQLSSSEYRILKTQFGTFFDISDEFYDY